MSVHIATHPQPDDVHHILGDRASVVIGEVSIIGPRSLDEQMRLFQAIARSASLVVADLEQRKVEQSNALDRAAARAVNSQRELSPFGSLPPRVPVQHIPVSDSVGGDAA